MRSFITHLHLIGIALGMLAASMSAQTAGSAKLQATLHDYPGNGENHYTVVWVTDSSDGFIRTLQKQGPKFSSGRWDEHFRTWNNARDDDTTVDGYSGATAKSYSSSYKNPIDLEWDCLDKSGRLVPDGDYKFWVQYVEEDDRQGPLTTLSWTKGPESATKTYPDHSDGGTLHHSKLSVTWTAEISPPNITSAAPASEATVGVSYSHICTATGTAPITFSTSGRLPTGLEISPAGEISGVPSGSGFFSGMIMASNGAASTAIQQFRITVVEVPTTITTAQVSGTDFRMEGRGPANGAFTIMGTDNLAVPLNEWTPFKVGTFDDAGLFSITVPIDSNDSKYFFRLRVP